MITVKELEHLADLARIRIGDDDKGPLLKEFDSILAYVDQIKKADVRLDAEATVGPVRNVMRPDLAENISDNARDRLLEEVPHKEGDLVAVKKIIAQD